MLAIAGYTAEPNYIYIYVIHSWLYGWTKLADNILGNPLPGLGMKKAEIFELFSFFRVFKISRATPGTSACLLYNYILLNNSDSTCLIYKCYIYHYFQFLNMHDAPDVEHLGRIFM